MAGDRLLGSERKLVSAVCVDIVGYTRLSESLDPEDVRRLLGAYWEDVREELERYGGTVEKFIGDAVVGLFGAPQAHEDDAERAVRAALAVRDRLRGGEGPEVRVAVATGLALVDRGARPEAGEALVVGDVVTTATRLQQGAPRGAVLVDEATHAASRSAIRYRRAEPVEAKGKRAPVAAWRALGPRPVLRRSARLSRFVGRRHELALLRTLAARVVAERSVQLVTVVGEPGIGKSRLLREVSLRGAERWEARALPYGEGSAFSPLAELVEAQAGVRDGEGAEAARAGLDAWLERLLPEPGERAHVAAHTRRLLGLAPAPGEASGSLESFAAWRRLLEAQTETRPLVLVLEDLHWADDALLDFVEHVLEWGAAVPLLLLCTTRPELLRRRPGWGGGAANAFTLSLPPLAPEEAARLVADVLGREPSADEAPALLGRAGGNPLYAEQLARMLRETGALAPTVPETVHAVIAARLDRLPPGSKDVLRDASVVGLTFPAAALAALEERDAAALEATLHELTRMELVEPGEGGEWSFRHRLVREVAYGELPRPARVERHVRVAEWLERRGRADELAEVVAHHYVRALEEATASGLPRDELAVRARRTLARAAERALALSAFSSAVRLYGEALDLWPTAEPERPAALLRYAFALWNAEVSGEAVALEARDALLAAGDLDGGAEAEALLSEMRWYRGDHVAAAAHLERAVALVAPRPPTRAKALVLSRLARTWMLSARYREAVETGSQALELARRLGLVELEAEALNTIGSARVRTGDRGGIADLERAIEVAAGTRAAAVAYNNLSAVLMEGGDRAGSVEAADRGRELAERLGDRLHLEWFRGEAVGRGFGAGDWDEVLAAADDWLATTSRPGYVRIGVLATRAFVRHGRSDPAAADDIAEAERLARAAGDPQALAPTLVEAAWIRLHEGEPDEARALAAEALALCERKGDLPPLAAFDLTVVCCDIGLEERLRPLLDAAPPGSRWVQLARRYADGDLEGALELVPERDSGWVAAYLWLRSAERSGPGLEEALAWYEAAGASRYARRCEAVAEGWRNGTPPPQPAASAGSAVGGVTSGATPSGSGRRSA